MFIVTIMMIDYMLLQNDVLGQAHVMRPYNELHFTVILAIIMYLN